MVLMSYFGAKSKTCSNENHSCVYCYVYEFNVYLTRGFEKFLGFYFYMVLFQMIV